MEEGKSLRTFDKEFKEEAVKLLNEGGRPVAEVARNLGIHENLLHKWKRQLAEDPEEAYPGKGYLKAQDEEIWRLKRELANTREK